MTTAASQPQPPERSEIPTVGPTKVTTQKPKDPKRVEAGKRLAQISKEARERKMRAKIEAEIQSEKSDWPTTAIVIGVVGLLLAGVSVYYARAQHKCDIMKPEVLSQYDGHVHIKNEAPHLKQTKLDTL